MKNFKSINLIIGVVLFFTNQLTAQIGYYDAPYVRYEADLGTLANATTTTKSYNQTDLQSEASEQKCVNMTTAGASVNWTVSADGDGLVVRYSVPNGQSGVLEVYADNVLVGTLNLTSYYSWEDLKNNGNPNNVGISNVNPRMRFDEVRMKLPSKILAGGDLKIVTQSGAVYLDFAELELVPAAIPLAVGDIQYTGDGSDLQTFIDTHGGSKIYIPTGVYDVNRELYFGVNNTVLKGAGMWYSQLNFTHITTNGGLTADASGISFSDLYLTTVRNSRSSSYNGINGVFTATSTIHNIWTEHFECGAWIAQYHTSGPVYADGFTVSNCRFRNSYADGINLCKGTSNTIVEHCNFRNNGDDDMAIWSANGLECRSNTFRYNTSENCWRASGCAIYGGYNNKAHHLLIRDNLEAGIRVNNNFSGAGFNDNGMHEFSDITIQRCGSFNDLYYSPVGAIDLVCTSINGTRIKNVKFSNITILDSKNDAIYINKRSGGEGFYNLIFENVTIDGTGKEYPGNNANSLNWGRGYGILFVGNPSGYGIHCNMTYTNRGGNATSDINNAQIGTFSWTQTCITASTPEITSPATHGICDAPITLTATAAAPVGDVVSYVEFFVDNTSIGQDNTSYSLDWNNPIVGSHQVKAVAHYTPSGTISPSLIQTLTLEDGIFGTTTAPVIDGSVDALWNNFPSFSLDKVPVGVVTNAADLSATFKVTRDATNLYILVEVTDDILRNDGAANWQKDGLELYIDMGNDKGGSYVVGSDFQYSFVYNISTPKAGLTFAQGAKTGGYIFEIMIPWSTLGGAPANGDYMGFDLHVEDNDSGNRNGKKSWKDATDNAWQYPSVLGTFQIAGCTNTYVPTEVITAETSEFNFYPNPFQNSGNLQINSDYLDNYSVSVKDMSGKLISSQTLSGTGPYAIGTNLLPGMYLLEVFDGYKRQTIKLVKL